MSNLAVESLKEAYEYLFKVYRGCENTIQLFRVGDEAKACEMIILISEGLEWLVDVITLTREIQQDEIRLDELNELMGEIIEGLENEDTLLLADLLEYELLPKLKGIQEQLKQVV